MPLWFTFILFWQDGAPPGDDDFTQKMSMLADNGELDKGQWACDSQYVFIVLPFSCYAFFSKHISILYHCKIQCILLNFMFIVLKSVFLSCCSLYSILHSITYLRYIWWFDGMQTVCGSQVIDQPFQIRKGILLQQNLAYNMV